MSLSIQQASYYHTDKELLFNNVSFSLEKKQKAGLVGNNGTGKSTLLRIIRGELRLASGHIVCADTPYYVPQHFGQYNDLTIAQALCIDKKLAALEAIIAGDASAENFAILNDDWDMEERSRAALDQWGLTRFPLHHPMSLLSGGEKTKVFLAGIEVHAPEIVLLDEPTNHLDREARQLLYDFVQKTKAILLVVSHDRQLLNLLSHTFELTKNGITAYGGNYDFYKAEKEKVLQSLQGELEEKEKQLRLARKTAREVAERKQKQDVRGERRNEKKGVPRIMMGGLKNNAENTSSKLKSVHDEKQQELAQDLTAIRSSLTDVSRMKVDFNSSSLHKGKVLLELKGVNHQFESDPLWSQPLDLQLLSGQRLSIEGANGSGKTTLLRLITGHLLPSEGEIVRAPGLNYVYIDQEYSLISNRLTILEQAYSYNDRHLPEHEVKTILNRYLFPLAAWDKSCAKLSGGEKMRLTLCCLMIGNNTPDLFILDEPTNNIDIRNMEILTATVRDYEGTVLVVSHDEYFKEEIGVEMRFRVSGNYDNHRLSSPG